MSTYVYGFAPATHPMPIDGLTGVSAANAPVRLIREDGLVAVVSDAPEGLRAKRRDLEAHERVLESLCAAGTVMPMRFGMVASDDSVVQAELTSKAEKYADLLAELDDHVELNVKAAHNEDHTLVRRIGADARGVRIEITGPWPPYSFAGLDLGGEL